MLTLIGLFSFISTCVLCGKIVALEETVEELRNRKNTNNNQ